MEERRQGEEGDSGGVSRIEFQQTDKNLVFLTM
jgi:hypothetical protein